MKIKLERSGGFAGIPRKYELDLRLLEPAEHDCLQSAVAAAGFFDLPEIISAASTGADQLHYILTIHDGKCKHSIQASEPDIPEGLRHLIEEITHIGRSAVKK